MSVKNENQCNRWRKGYLNVKLAINLGSIVGQYKLWSKKWTEVSASSGHLDDLGHSGHLAHIALDVRIFRSYKSENCIYRKRFESRNTAIFRCHSRKQSYAFTICDNNEPIIHLSADSETESQRWMQWLRNSLWPPNPLMEYENSIKGHFYASVIDDQSSHRNGLLGAYGYLQTSSTNLVLTHPQTGHVIQEWLLSHHKLKNPFENVIEIVKSISSFSGLQKTFIFCEDAKQIIERTNRKSLSHTCPEPERSAVTATRVANTNTISTIDCNQFRIRSVTEIPETMLDCSLSSNRCFLRSRQSDDSIDNIYSEPLDPFDFIESDIYEDIDRIYEEIITRDISDNNNLENSSNTSIHSKPIDIRSGQLVAENDCSNQMIGYDMFSKIVRQTNVPLMSRSLSHRRSDLSQSGSDNQSEDNYYEMRPIFERQSINGFKDLDENQYIYMKSFSL